MVNFEYYTPTKVVFGKDTQSRAGELCKAYGATKVLVHYGSGSVVRSGLLGRVKESLDQEKIAYVELGNPGVPHAVREVPGLSYEKKDEYHAMAKALRHDPAFPKGANANLYTWISEDAIRILTFERGVEDYTLACGTGTGSTAVKLWMEGKIPSGRLVVQNMGGLLVVTIEGDENGVTSILLDGGAEVLKKYEI